MKTENPYSDLVKTPRPKTIKEREAEVRARLEKENKELKNDIWNWEKKYNLLFETYTEFLNHVNSK